MSKKGKQQFYIPCPHCGSNSTADKTLRIGSMLEVGMRCTNADCAHGFVILVEPTRTISPPSIPRPGVAIPLDPSIDRKGLIEALQKLPDAAPAAIPTG